MAKMKLKVNWKGMLVAHGEKIVAALLAIMILMVIWSGIGRDQLPAGHDPDAIVKLASNAKSNIGNTPWERFSQRPELKNYNNRSIMDRVELDPYTTVTAYDNVIIQHKVRRGDPVLLTVSDIEAHASFGAFAIVDEDRIARREEDESIDDFLKPKVQGDAGVAAGGMRQQRSNAGYHMNDLDLIKGIRYTVVTGLVPIAEQQDQYNAVFQSAIGYDPHNDVPTYLGYVVERRDIAEDGTQSDWAIKLVFQPRTLRKQAISWSGTMPDVVQEKYTSDRLTFPLGPLVLKNWGREVAHAKVPIGVKQVQEPEARPRRGTEQENQNPDDIVEDRRPRPKSVPVREDKKPQESAAVKLLRYFDFAVEPGKQYQYRFRLVLHDPNTTREKSDVTPAGPANSAGVPTTPVVAVTMLKQEVIDRINDPKVKGKNMRFSDWSEPSPVVSIPYDNRLLAGSVERPARPGADIQVNVMVKSFDIERGIEIIGQEKFSRGSIVRFKQDVSVIDPKSGKSETLEQYVFDPQAIILDIRGSATPPKGQSLVEPAEVLFQDQTGRLVVHSELADEQEFQESLGHISRPAVEPNAPSLTGGATPAPAGKKDASVDASGLLDSGKPSKRKDR